MWFRYRFIPWYGIGRKSQPIWVSVSDVNQNSGFGRTLNRIVEATLSAPLLLQKIDTNLFSEQGNDRTFWRRSRHIPSKTTSRLFLYLDSTDVMVREEGYCLFDFNLIISSCMGCQLDKTGPCIYQKCLIFASLISTTCQNRIISGLDNLQQNWRNF